MIHTFAGERLLVPRTLEQQRELVREIVETFDAVELDAFERAGVVAAGSGTHFDERRNTSNRQGATFGVTQAELERQERGRLELEAREAQPTLWEAA